ncbi:DUF624 domain-containing protein [Glycomyces sp. TRM65418]|uniref:YesL family protein n=1 Tax=Glycomyces sp. TRM65418 TaxID=2867006 RepID=UPI001CE5AFA8|nr:DUF624 domain-containing protein [Glycomyces sp. TRM65418]MCC3763777.1 DUF624 domain-containing protein [Glycomyces sp. TRM65418]QZD53487.1 DUF624 domain-containing protein [Glycomyces sp. TRM65418]
MREAFLDWYQRLGRLGLRLLCLHLLWLAWTLRGGVLLGVFPATAALHGVLREDARFAIAHPDEQPALAGLRAGFRELWRREFAAANRLGVLLVLGWATLVLDRRVTAAIDLGGLGPLIAGGLTVAGVWLGVVTVLVWPLQSHFDEGAWALLRRALILTAARPATAAMAGTGVGVLWCAYYLVPGLIPVFGLAAPAAVATAVLWRSGVLAASLAPAAP